VGIATRYGLEGPGIEFRWGEIFRTYPDRLRSPPSFLYNGYRLFPGGKSGRGVMVTTHPLLVPRLRKSLSIPPLTLWVLPGLLRGSLYLYLYCSYRSKQHHSFFNCCLSVHVDNYTIINPTECTRCLLLKARDITICTFLSCIFAPTCFNPRGSSSGGSTPVPG
jgi:hypothetical protein